MKKSVAQILKISCLLGLFLFAFPFHVSASSLALAPETLNEVQGLFYGIEYSQMSVDGAMSYSMPTSQDISKFAKYKRAGLDLEDYLNSVDGIDGLNNISLSDFTVGTLPSESYNSFSEMTLYNSNGEVISIDDCTYLTYDNGYFSGSCLIDDTGSLIYDTVSAENPILDCKMGGKTLDQEHLLQKCSDFTDYVKNNGYLYAKNAETVSVSPTYYVWKYDLQYGQQYFCYDVFISNQYQPGLIVALPDNNGVIYQWYTNDKSLIQTHITHGNLVNGSYSNGPFNYNGYTYAYRYVLNGGNTLNTDTIVPYNPGGSGKYGSVYAKSGYTYNNNIASSGYSSYYQTDTATLPNTLPDTYSLADTLSYCDAISAVNTATNIDFDGTDAISAVNYPVSKEVVLELAPSVFPFPDVLDYPIVLAPDISYPLDTDITSENIAPFDQIPIISNLERRFPFSIPWDIKNMLSILRSRAQAPYFEFDITFPVINYTWHFVLDLSPFDGTAELFRLCFLISFVLGLAVFSYQHFFGS